MNHTLRLFALLLVVLALASCGVSRFIPEGRYLLDKVSVRCDSNLVPPSTMEGFIRQHPNSRWFTLWRAPMLPYMIMGRDTTRRFNRFLMRMGERPRICDTLETERSRRNMQSAVRNLGYLHDTVVAECTYRKRAVRINYQIHPGPLYHVSRIDYDIQDTTLLALADSLRQGTLLHTGMPLDANILDQERTRLVGEMHNRGYFHFNTDFIRFTADTTAAGRDVWLTLHLLPYATALRPEPSAHRPFHIGHVNVTTREGQGHLRPHVLDNAVRLKDSTLYRYADVQQTYAAFARLGATLSPVIRLTENEADSTLLDCDIQVAMQKRHTVSLEVEGTNSAGDLGVAASTAYQNRNIFHGSELLTLKLRGAFEAIKGLDGYADQNYIEYSAEARLTFPRFSFPFTRRSMRHKGTTTSELSFMYDSQDRPEFHRRVVTGAWRYKWALPRHNQQHRVDILDLNYVYMPWISGTFRREYLDDPTSRNAILRYNYDNLFIMKSGYTLSFSTARNKMNAQYGSNAYSLRFNIETAGNLLYGLSNAIRGAKDSEGHYKFLNIAFAQYVKGDFDWSKSFRFDQRNSLALHVGLGLAYPYGNSTILPYEKRYFSGGANSVRGWSVRGLGPGSFKGTDGRIDFINQTGDIKLDMNLEYRTHLFWMMDAAVFIDAGNIWTIRDYAEQPGGQFRFDTCWRQIAVAYGLGLRLNFTYFILRLDGGMKAINPAYTDARHHYPIIHPRFNRDFSLHFAVGLPF